MSGRRGRNGQGAAHYGAQAAIGSMDVSRHPGAHLRQRGDGVQRLGTGGARALQAAVPVRDQAGDVGRLRTGAAVGGDARGLPHLPQRTPDLGAARRRRHTAGGGAVLARGQRHPPLVRRGRLRHPAVGTGQARGDLLHRADSRAPLAAHQRGRLRAGADRADHGGPARPDPARARLRHRSVAARGGRRDDLRRRPQLQVPGRRGAADGAGAGDRPDPGALSRQAPHGLPGSVGGSARRRLSDHPVADRRRHRRRVRQGADGRQAEAVLPARSPTPTSSTR